MHHIMLQLRCLVRIQWPKSILIRSIQTSTHTPVSQLKPIRFTPLKDKTSLIDQFHKHKELPFNILRDVIGIPQFSPRSQDDVYEAWLSYVNMGDVHILKELIKSDEEFWLKTIRISISTPQIIHPMFQLYAIEETRSDLGIPKDLPETMCACLIYHGKDEFATYISDRFLLKRDDVNWKPLISLALTSEEPLGIHFLSTLYNNSTKQHYIPITNHLKTLNIKPSLTQHWANLLISNGDFPKDSSHHLNDCFQSKLKSQNLKSLQSALKFISRYKIPNDWLKDDTAYLLSVYITKIPDPDQETELRRVLECLKGQSFGLQFWKTLYRLSTIRLRLLDSLVTKFEIAANHPLIIKSKGRRILDNKPKEFWSFVQKYSNDDAILSSISSLIMVKMIRSSNDLLRALQFAQNLMLNAKTPSLHNEIIKSFIMEVTKKITKNRLYHHVKVLQRFELFLKENDLFTDEVQNYFIYADSQLLRFTHTIDRLNELLDQDASVIEPGTVDSIVTQFFKYDDLLMKRVVFDSYNDTPVLQILKLILRCYDHCPSQFKPITWGRIFNEIGHSFEMKQTHEFILEITNRILQTNPEIRNNSSQSDNALRVIFSDVLIRKILFWGFTKDKENPWSGFELIKDLEKLGVYVPVKLVKKQLLRYVRILHRVPGMEIPEKLRVDIPVYDVETTIKSLNKIHDG